MNLEHEAELYANDLRTTIPNNMAKFLKRPNGADKTEIAQEYLSILEHVLSKQDIQKFIEFLKGESPKADGRTLNIIMSGMGRVEKLMPSVQTHKRQTPPGAEGFQYTLDYFRAIDLITY